MRTLLQEYFNFNRRDRNGVLLLVILVFLFGAFRFVYPYCFPEKQVDPHYEAMIRALKIGGKEADIALKRREHDPITETFNPNELDWETSIKIGLTGKQWQSIKKYLDKGGRFKKKEDFAKMWVIDEEDYQRLEPHIVIPKQAFEDSNSETNPYSNAVNSRSSNDKRSKNNKIFQGTFQNNEADLKPFPFHLNEMNASLAKKLGLPTKVCQNIEKYLASGGKFYKKNDLAKIYNLTDEMFEQLEPFIQNKEQTEQGSKHQFEQFRQNSAFFQNASQEKQDRLIEYPTPKPFDPNKLDFDKALALGLPKKVAQNIDKYIKKGGRFFKKEDLKKIYDFELEDYKRLESFIVIEIEGEQKEQEKTEIVAIAKPSIPQIQIDINKASKEEWTKIRGIGDYFADKILEYKKDLGGFIDKSQLLEVYRMDEERYAQILPNLIFGEHVVKKININTADANTLAKHPYINYKMANSIVKIRKQHGSYKSVEDVGQSHLITKDLLKKVKPYLTVEE